MELFTCNCHSLRQLFFFFLFLPFRFVTIHGHNKQALDNVNLLPSITLRPKHNNSNNNNKHYLTGYITEFQGYAC
jgi:hypothetical protein